MLPSRLIYIRFDHACNVRRRKLLSSFLLLVDPGSNDGVGAEVLQRVLAPVVVLQPVSMRLKTLEYEPTSNTSTLISYLCIFCLSPSHSISCTFRMLLLK